MSRTIVVSVDQLSRPQPGGIASYVRGLLRGLAEVAPTEHVVALGPAPALASLGVSLDTATVPGPQALVPHLWERWPLGVPRHASVVHATSMAGPFGGATDVQSAALHDLLWRDEPSATTARGAAFHERRLQRLLARSDIRLLTSSPLLRDRLLDLGVDTTRIFPVRLGVDDDGVVPATSAEVRHLLAQHGVRGPFTLHAGTREPRKNTSRLVAAHAIAAHREPEVGTLVFVGPDGWGAAPTGDAIVLGPVDRTVLLGLYREASLVAYVPRAEGFGLPPVEALRAGARVVASVTTPSVAANREVVLVDPLDVDAIVEGLVNATGLRVDEHAQQRRRDSVADLTWANSARDHLAAWR
jgi:glycosyltransferase involved in cell wall biosynthesis